MTRFLISFVLLWLLVPSVGRGEEILFEDNFKTELSPKWQIGDLKKSDYRFRNGGLELGVQPGKQTSKTPLLKVFLPFTSDETVIASVKITVLNEFTQERESAGVYLIDEKGLEFGARKELVGGKLVFSPGDYDFVGKPGEEGDVSKYKVTYTAESPQAGPLRIIVDRGNAFFQVGPTADDKYATYFMSALRKKSTQRGFALYAAGAPEGAEHWVRFENFKVFHR